MQKVIRSVAIELTRRCNQSCKHCLRGNAQDIDIEKDYIDLLFAEDIIIQNLILSGGEPTLCENLIVYVIDKIINEHKSILSIYMATNGLICSDKVLSSFSRYREYVAQNLKPLYEDFPIPNRFLSFIELSNDQFHEKIDLDLYKEKALVYPNVTLETRGLVFWILLVGRAKENKIYLGVKSAYKLYDLDIYVVDDKIIFDNAFYLTATSSYLYFIFSNSENNSVTDFFIATPYYLNGC